MNLQYLNDISGKPTGVFIPIREWNKIKDYIDGFYNEENVVLKELKQAIKEMNLIKKGKLKATDAKDLLNEL